jgi:hypothetical protein
MADTALYAVFLPGERDVQALTEQLRRAPSRGTGRVRTVLETHGGYEPLSLEPNGALAIFADEAVIGDRRVVVVVNSRGEILGTRPLWEADRELAVAID